jgi:hypothetical protein
MPTMKEVAGRAGEPPCAQPRDQRDAKVGNHRSRRDYLFLHADYRGSEKSAWEQGYLLIAVNSADSAERQVELFFTVPALEMGIDRLISMGYRRIAIVTGPLAPRNERRAAIRIDEGPSLEGNLRIEDVKTMSRERLRKPSRPVTIFCANGPTAPGALRALRSCGLKTPEEIGFATSKERQHKSSRGHAEMVCLPAILKIRFSSARKALRSHSEAHQWGR